MFSIPLYIFLAAFLIYFVFFLLFSAANVYHIYSTATFTMPALVITLWVSLWCIVIVAATFVAVSGVDWQSSIVFLGSNGIISFQ